VEIKHYEAGSKHHSQAWQTRIKDIETSARDYPARIIVDEGAYNLDHDPSKAKVEFGSHSSSSSANGGPLVGNIAEGLLQITRYHTTLPDSQMSGPTSEMGEGGTADPAVLTGESHHVSPIWTLQRSAGIVAPTVGGGVQIVSAPNKANLSPATKHSQVHSPDLMSKRSLIRERTREAIRLKRSMALAARFPQLDLPHGQSIPRTLPPINSGSSSSATTGGSVPPNETDDNGPASHRSEDSSSSRSGHVRALDDLIFPTADPALLTWLRHEEARLDRGDESSFAKITTFGEGSAMLQFLPQLIKYARQLAAFAADAKANLQFSLQEKQRLSRRLQEADALRMQAERARAVAQAQLRHEEETRERWVNEKVEEAVRLAEEKLQEKIQKIEMEAESRGRSATLAEVQRRIEAGEEPIKSEEIPGGGGKSWLARQRRLRAKINASPMLDMSGLGSNQSSPRSWPGSPSGTGGGGRAGSGDGEDTESQSDDDEQERKQDAEEKVNEEAQVEGDGPKSRPRAAKGVAGSPHLTKKAKLRSRKSANANTSDSMHRQLGIATESDVSTGHSEVPSFSNIYPPLPGKKLIAKKQSKRRISDSTSFDSSGWISTTTLNGSHPGAQDTQVEERHSMDARREQGSISDAAEDIALKRARERAQARAEARKARQLAKQNKLRERQQWLKLQSSHQLEELSNPPEELSDLTEVSDNGYETVDPSEDEHDGRTSRSFAGRLVPSRPEGPQVKSRERRNWKPHPSVSGRVGSQASASAAASMGATSNEPRSGDAKSTHTTSGMGTEPDDVQASMEHGPHHSQHHHPHSTSSRPNSQQSVRSHADGHVSRTESRQGHNLDVHDDLNRRRNATIDHADCIPIPVHNAEIARLQQLLDTLNQELIATKDELTRTREIIPIQLAAASQAAMQAKEQAEARAAKAERALEAAIQQEKMWEQRLNEHREREAKIRAELEEKLKRETEILTEKMGEIAEKLELERAKARAERSEWQERSRSLQAQLHAQLTGHVTKERLFAEREGQIAMLTMSKAALERQVEAMRNEIESLRTRERAASRAASELPDKVQTLRSKLANIVSGLSVAHSELAQAAVAAAVASGTEASDSVKTVDAAANAAAEAAAAGLNLTRQQALALRAQVAEALKRQAELELELTSKEAELDQLRTMASSHDALTKELEEVRARADTQTQIATELQNTINTIVKEAPQKARKEAELQYRKEQRAQRRKEARTALKDVGITFDEDSKSAQASDKLPQQPSADSTARESAESRQDEDPQAADYAEDQEDELMEELRITIEDEFRDAKEELGIQPTDKVILPLSQWGNLAFRTPKGQLIRAKDIASGRLPKNLAEANANEPASEEPKASPSQIASLTKKLRETQARLSETELDLTTMSRKYTLVLGRLDSLKDDMEALNKRYKAEVSLNAQIKLLTGAAGSIDALGSPDAGKIVAEKVSAAMEQMHKRLYEESEARVEKLRKTLDAQHAELSQAQSSLVRAEAQTREVTERLQIAVTQISNLESILESLGLSSDALQRANEIIANHRHGYQGGVPGLGSPGGRLDDLSMSPTTPGGTPHTADQAMQRAKQAVQLALEVDSLRAQVKKLQEDVSAREDQITLLQGELRTQKEFAAKVEKYLDPETQTTSPSPVSSTSKDVDKQAAELATLRKEYIKASRQLALVSKSHLECPSTIAKLQAQVKEATSVLEACKVEFARRRGQLESDLALERDRSAFAASKLRELQEAAADRRAELRLEYERALTVLRESNQKLENHVHALVLQLQDAGIEPKSLKDFSSSETPRGTDAG